ncbi:MAG TPA: large conductance mechanosensitive channel protein MscL [Sphingobium sp.]|nr:large conductance mechanosensitive channel protein MscL [Sphingobium sp.]
MLDEFRTFIARGNVLDLAVGVIIGGAFGTIVKSLTDDLIMPVIGWLFGGVNFSNYFLRLGDIPAGFRGNPTSYADLKAAGVAMFGWGEFVTVLINFLLLAFVIFLIVRTANRLLRKPAEAPEPADITLLREIRDSLRK